jgi:hypothetical protein
MANRRALPVEECLAVQAELEALYRRHGSDQAVAEWLDCSQQTVHRARTKAQVGPLVAANLYKYLNVSREIVLAKHRELRPTEAAPEQAAPVVAEGNALPHDKFPARATAARRATIAKHWEITPSAIRYVCTAPEWQSPRFSTRDAVFWVEQMKLQTHEEARATPATEEERIFQKALRKLNARRAKEKAKEKRAEAERVAGEEAAAETAVASEVGAIKAAG